MGSAMRHDMRRDGRCFWRAFLLYLKRELTPAMGRRPDGEPFAQGLSWKSLKTVGGPVHLPEGKSGSHDGAFDLILWKMRRGA